MRGSRIGTRYAKALLELATEQGQIDKIGEDLARFGAAWGTSAALRALFLDPVNGADDRRRVVDALCARLDCAELVRNTLRLLSDRRRMAHLPGVVDAYEHLSETAAGKLRAEITTAVELDDAYYEALRDALSAATGKNVVLVRRTDPGVLGGVVTRIGDTIIDGSLRTQIDELSDELLAR